ncbi:hypothetical protein [Gordonibacter sp.]|uniref:hypothetical protein n=1 Tax=Gordonibacter sp. TaxID=1968902 RepID=UPI002FC9579F
MPYKSRIYLALSQQIDRQESGKAKADFKQNSRKLQALRIIRYDGYGTAVGRTGYAA